MKTHAESVWKPAPFLLLCCAGFLAGVAGCGWSSSTPLEASVDEKPAEQSVPKPDEAAQEKPDSNSGETVETTEAVAAPQTLAELTDAIEVALTDSATTSRSDPNRGGIARTAALRRQIDFGIEVANELIAANPDDQQAVAKAWRAKLTLLYRGASEGLENCAEQLASASAAAAGTPFQEEAEYGNGLVVGIQYLDSDKPIHEVAEQLTRHARTYRDGNSSVRLFLAYAKKLVKEDRVVDANAICQAALWELHGHPEIAHIRQFVKSLSEGETQKAETRRRDIVQKLIENQVAQIKPSLPLQIDELTILYEVEADYRMVIYKYRVALDLNEFRSEQRTIEEEISRKARSTAATRKMLDKGIRMKYMYFGKDGTPFHDFIVQSR